MTKIYNQLLQKVEYHNEGQRSLWRQGDLVYKQDLVRLNQDWNQKMQAILNIWSIPGFIFN